MQNDQSKLLPMLERRRIEAGILKHVFETLEASHGRSVAEQTVANAVKASSIEQAQAMAAEVGGQTSMQTFVDRQTQWTAGGALEVEVHEQSDRNYRFDVVRCRYSEMYREMGLGDIGHLLSCQRDGTFCEGYDPRLKLTRTQTIMQGASHCDFDYRLEDDQTRATDENK
ncbi:MAG: L-2-amino-thiazoline-4-carboxylic acid hydrolase [Hyphomicrobiaceae bacterium]